MWGMKDKVKCYDSLFHNMINILESDIGDLIEIGIVVKKSDEEYYYPEEFEYMVISDFNCWVNKFVYNNIQLKIYAYVIQNDMFVQKMENSYSDSGKFLLFDYFIKRVLQNMSQLIQDDFKHNNVTIHYPGDKELILFQSIVDFFVDNDLPDINCINFISSVTYESVLCRGKILFIDQMEIDSYTNIKFKNSIYFDKKNYRMIRKLLELTNKGDYLLVNSLYNEIIGVSYNLSDAEKHNNYILEIIGHMHWMLKYNDMVVLEYKGGCYYIIDENAGRRKYIQQVEKCVNIFLDKKMCQKDLIKLIDCAKQQIHGTLIIICSDAYKEAERLCLKNRGIFVEPFAVLKNTKIIESITSIDGALLLDENFICYAIGVILDGIATQGDSSRGARYNSALTYVEGIKKNHSVCAIVVSEDGFIDIIC